MLVNEVYIFTKNVLGLEVQKNQLAINNVFQVSMRLNLPKDFTNLNSIGPKAN